MHKTEDTKCKTTLQRKKKAKKMGASKIETEYNEINSKNGWSMEFQVNFDLLDKIKNRQNRKKNKQIFHRTF